MAKFHERLLNERKRLGLTQAQFAERCGVTVTSQVFYEKGDRSPNAEYLEHAVKAGIDIYYLFNQTDMPADTSNHVSPPSLEQFEPEIRPKIREFLASYSNYIFQMMVSINKR